MRRAWCALLAALPLVAAADVLKLDGEVFARQSVALSPPAIEEMWQLNISFLMPDGAQVEQGQPVLGFEGGDLQARLVEKNSTLAEKRTQLDKLRLELAERERTEHLATEQARAQRDKAQRKAAQPEDLLRRVDYQKLVVEREQSERLLALAERREALAAEQRRQELELLQAETRQLEGEVAALEQAIGSLTVTAPRAGVMLHRTNWNGEKFDIGSQVWRGQSVAEIPDPATLAVRAQLPEADYLHARTGAAVTVRVEGTGVSIAGRIAGIGRMVRSKSRLQPVPVVDLLIEFDGDARAVKPGQSVRVELNTEDAQ